MRVDQYLFVACCARCGVEGRCCASGPVPVCGLLCAVWSGRTLLCEWTSTCLWLAVRGVSVGAERMTMRAATKSWKEKGMPIIVRVEVSRHPTTHAKRLKR